MRESKKMRTKSHFFEFPKSEACVNATGSKYGLGQIDILIHV